MGGTNAGETLLTLSAGGLTTVGVLPPGTELAGYRITSRAGAGGMGVVYRARDGELDRTVALKVIAPQLAREERFRGLFREESRKAASLEHPNVIPIYRSGEDDGQLYIAMRFVDGPSLQELIDQRGRLPLGAAVRIVSQIADALDAAHAIGLVHRDVKPGNVLVTSAGGEEHVLLTDFGLSLPMPRGAAASDGQYLGTPAYLAPEQIRGGQVDARTDVYALGCVLFHLLTGRVPFPASGFEAKVVAHLTAAPPLVTDEVPDLPRSLDEVVRRAMAKRPEDRFGSAGELAAAARAARSDVVVCAHPDDIGAAQAVAARLTGHGLDVRSIGDGQGADLRSADACLLVVGRHGVADWAREILAEANAVQFADPRFMTVPVLLPGAPEPFDAALAALTSRRFVDLRAGLDESHVTADLLRALDASPAGADGPGADDRCPYLGLEAFGEEDADLFFGRRTETALLAAKLATGRFLTVLGASGSGKSSLVRAGLIPRLRAAAACEVVVLTPGPNPLAALAGRLRAALGRDAPAVEELFADARALDAAAGRVAARPGRPRLLVVVDQFEETFSLNPSARERQVFIDALVYAATIPEGNATVVLAMRSDFYHRSADHPALRALIAEQQFLVGPLTGEGYRQIIEEPARLAGLELEQGLTRRIVTDVADEPGALPLVEHLLAQLWERRRGRLMTLEAYTAAGGVGGALAQHADAVYQRLEPEGRVVARSVLLRLTQPGEGTEDTRRRALLSELATTDGDEHAVRELVDGFVADRLLILSTDPVTGEPAVEVAHEALIRGWPELRTWIDADREHLRLHRRLTEATAEWIAGGEDDGGLLRGTRLALWRDRPTDALNDRERRFLQASRDRADREQATRRRRIRLTISGAGVAAVLVAAGIAVAVTQSSNAHTERIAAESRQFATAADASLGADPELSLLLAAAGEQRDDTPEAEEALRQAAAASSVRGAIRDTGTIINTIRNVGDGTAVLAGDDGSLRVWNPADDPRAAKVDVLGKWPKGVNAVAKVQGGFVTGGNDGKIVMWPSAGSPRVLGDQKATVWQIAAQPGGTSVLSGGESGVWRWDTATGAGQRVVPGTFYGMADLGTKGVAVVDSDFVAEIIVGGVSRKLGPAQTVGVSPDGRLLAVGTGTALEIWSIEGTPRRLSSRPVSGGVNGMAFTRDAGYVAVSGGDGNATVFPGRTGPAVAQLHGHQGPLAGIAFLDATHLLTGGTDGTARFWNWTAGVPAEVPVGIMAARGGIWLSADVVQAVDGEGAVWRSNAATGAQRALPPTSGVTMSAAFSDDGSTVWQGADSGKIVARRVDGTALGEWTLPDLPLAIGADADGKRAVVAVRDGTLVELRLGSPDHRELAKRGSPTIAVAIAPDGASIAAGYQDGKVLLIGAGPSPIEVGSHASPVFDASFSPDGTHLVTAGSDRTVRVWDVVRRKQVRSFNRHAGAVNAVRVTADGQRIVSGGEDGVLVWDLESGKLLWRHTARSVQGLAVDGAGPRIAYYGLTPGASVSDCDVCGSLSDVTTLVPQRTTRELTPAERVG